MALHKTLATMRTAVRDALDESSASFWTDAELGRAINRAKDRVQAEIRRLKDDFFEVTRSSTDGSLTILGESYSAASFAVAVGTRDYTLPPDFLEMKLIEVLTSGYESVRFIARDLAHPDMREALEVVENQAPNEFLFDIIGERTLRIGPKSATALDLRLTYLQQFPDLSADADELTMMHPLYMAVEEYAIATAMLKDRDPNSAAHEARAKQIIADVFGGAARQIQDIEVAQGYGGFA